MDRNCVPSNVVTSGSGSPPARVAWIETRYDPSTGEVYGVATREGGVDRNIETLPKMFRACVVATREGGVDRNTALIKSKGYRISRHPRGWRG